MINANDETQWAYLLDPTFELINTAGKPLTGGWINVYVAGTRNKYYCASDFNGTLHPFDIPLDSLGANIVLASPEFRYDVYVYNKFGTLVMSRYNVAPTLGGSVSVSGINDIVSDDGTVTINQYGDTFSLSIADTVSAVSGLDMRVQDLESAVTGIEASLDGKKDLQAPYNASGTNVQTITNVTQDENGVITVEYSDIQAQNPLTPGQYVTIDDDVISVTGLQPEGDYATEDYVDAAVSGLEPIDITSTDGSITVSSSVSGSVKVFDISVSGGQPVYFRGGDTWIPVSGTTADFSTVKKFDGTIVPSDIVSGTVPLEDGLWAWDAIVDIYVGGHVNELVKCGIKGQAVGGAYDPDSETELLIDSTRPGVINSFTLTGLSRGGPNTRLAFTFTRENTSTSTMWVRMRRLSVYQVKGPGISQSGGGGDYEAGWGIIINGDVISVNNAIIPDIDTVSGMIIDATGDFATRSEVNTVSGAIVNMIPEIEITPTLASGTKIAEYSVDGVSGELFAPFTGEVVYVTTSNTFAEVKGIIDSGKMPVFVDDNHIYHYLESYPVPSTTALTFKGGHYPIQQAGTGFYVNNYVGNRYWKIKANDDWSMEIADLNYIEAAPSGALTTRAYGPGYTYRVSMAVNTDGTTIHVNENNELEVIGGGGSSYTAGSGIDITNNVISVSGVALSSDLVNADWDAVSGLSEILNKPETVVVDTVPVIAGSGISITASGSDIVISCTASGGGSDVTITPTLASGTKLADYSIDGVSGELFAPEAVEVETVPVIAGSGISITDSDSGIVISCTASGGGSTYTAGEYISIENDEISVTGIDPDSFASQADLEAVSAAIPSGSYDLVAGQNITITASGTNLIISGQQGGTNVTITPDYNSGTRVARYSIDGVNGSIYTPTQVNANWNETSSSSKAYIQNKPTIHTYTGASGVAIDANDVVSLDSPVELVPGANITIEVSGVSAVISSTGGGGGTTYTAGNMISLTNNAIAVSTTAGITDIQKVASLPANPVSTVLYLIPEA